MSFQIWSHLLPSCVLLQMSTHSFLVLFPTNVSDVTKLNAAISGNSELQGKSLDEIMASATGGVFNNAAQVPQVPWTTCFGRCPEDATE